MRSRDTVSVALLSGKGSETVFTGAVKCWLETEGFDHKHFGWGFETMNTLKVRGVCGLMLIALVAPQAGAVEWADNMFPVKKHEFGTVAVAAKTEFRFPFKNLYKEDVHVSTVRASCGCTTPIIENHTLKTGETGHILARFNTGSFHGKKGATLTVVIDKPYYAEVQLRVDGYIRRDIVFNPGQVEFGSVMQGESVHKEIGVTYAGRSDWKIVEVQSPSPNVAAAFEEVSRNGGRVSYKLNVAFDGAAEPGQAHTNIVVITNDRAMPRVPLEVTYEVRPAVIVSPQVMAIGNLKPGESSEQRLVVRSDKPFRLTDIKAEGFSIEYKANAESKKMHVLPLKITAGDKAGSMSQRLIVHTDLPGSALVAGQIVAK
eukprot:TRINITY_DN9433_c0_g1_i1.p1 TRINITY_DN9433_c0_g1~~TRINITY_DN9433_c0_g1_i1.p1  ORF type:complete len:373 (+),score=43.90 TRINITY_DN9433_c0_g1_i1:94-1212(+)